VVAQRAGRDLLRQEIVVVGPAGAAPVAIAAAAELGVVPDVTLIIAFAGAARVGSRIGVGAAGVVTRAGALVACALLACAPRTGKRDLDR
jgi:hypothetical protein